MERLKLKYRIGLLLTSLLFVVADAQVTSNPIDSLEKVLESSLTKSDELKVLLKLGQLYSVQSGQKTVEYAQAAIALATKLKDSTSLNRAYIQEGFGFGFIGETSKQIESVKKAASVDRSPLAQSRVYNQLGQIFSTVDSDSCLYYFTKYYNVVLENGLSDMPLALQQVAVGYTKTGDYMRADSFYNLADKACHSPQHDQTRCMILYNKGALNYYLGNMDETFVDISAAYKMARKLNRINIQMPSLHLLGLVSYEQQDTITAIEYWKEMYQVGQKAGMKSQAMYTALRQLIDVFLRGQAIEDAADYTRKLYRLASQQGDAENIAAGLIYESRISQLSQLSDISMQKLAKGLEGLNKVSPSVGTIKLQLMAVTVLIGSEDYKKALEVLDQISPVLNKYGDMSLGIKLFESYYKVYSALNNTDKSLEYLTKFKELNDKWVSTANSKMLLKVNKEFEVEKKNILISNQSDSIRLLNEKNKANQRNLILGGLSALLAFIGFYLYRSSKFARQEREQQIAYSRNLINTQEEERKRVARELHDGVGQKLMFLSKKTNETGDRDMMQLASETLDEIRAISRGLHPDKLEKLGLSSALRSMLDEWDNNTDLFFTHDIDDVDQLMDRQVSLHVYRIIQEAVSNVIKHANAKAVMISLLNKGIFIEGIIEDNGIGFDIEQAATKSTLGMKTLEERSKIINAELQVNSLAGSGTKVVLKIPLSNHE